MKAVFLTVLIALCAAQRMEASPAAMDTRDLNSIIAQIKNVIQGIIEKVEEIDIESIIAKLQEGLAAAVQQAQNAVNAAVDRVKEIVGELVEQAAEEGKDIRHCVEGKDEELEQIKDETVAKVNACNQDAVASLEPARAKIVEVATEAQQLQKEAEEAIASCTSDAEQFAIDKETIKCLVSKLVPLKSRMAELGLKAYGVAEEAKAAYEAAAESSAVCRSQALIEASQSVAGLLAEVRKCVADA